MRSTTASSASCSAPKTRPGGQSRRQPDDEPQPSGSSNAGGDSSCHTAPGIARASARTRYRLRVVGAAAGGACRSAAFAAGMSRNRRCARRFQHRGGRLQQVPDAALEAARGFQAGLAFGAFAGQVVLGFWVAAGAGERDAVDGGVELAVAISPSSLAAVSGPNPGSESLLL